MIKLKQIDKPDVFLPHHYYNQLDRVYLEISNEGDTDLNTSLHLNCFDNNFEENLVYSEALGYSNITSYLQDIKKANKVYNNLEDKGKEISRLISIKILNFLNLITDTVKSEEARGILYFMFKEANREIEKGRFLSGERELNLIETSTELDTLLTEQNVDFNQQELIDGIKFIVQDINTKLY